LSRSKPRRQQKNHVEDVRMNSDVTEICKTSDNVSAGNALIVVVGVAEGIAGAAAVEVVGILTGETEISIVEGPDCQDLLGASMLYHERLIHTYPGTVEDAGMHAQLPEANPDL
jgi:hypothetical protein